VVVGDIEIITRFSESIWTYVNDINERCLNRQPDDVNDWVMFTSAYRNWIGFSSEELRYPVLWCKTSDTASISMNLAHRSLSEGFVIHHITTDGPDLFGLSCLQALGCSLQTMSILLSILCQAYMMNSHGSDDAQDFTTFIIESGMFDRKLGRQKATGAEASRVLSRILRRDGGKKRTFLIHNVDSLYKDTKTEISRVLGRLLETTSNMRVEGVRVAASGSDPNDLQQISRLSAIVDPGTEYLGNDAHFTSKSRFQQSTANQENRMPRSPPVLENECTSGANHHGLGRDQPLDMG
jgi:hypothetical protein